MWAPGLGYFFYVLLLPILICTAVCSQMNLVGGLTCAFLGILITGIVSIPYFSVAAIDPGIIPSKRFSGNAKLCGFKNYAYRMNFYHKLQLTHSYLQYCHNCLIFQPEEAYHCKECDLCINKKYFHHPFFLKCIGQRTIHYYILFLALNLFKNFYFFIVCCAALAFSLISPLIFFFICIGAMAGDMAFMHHCGKWIYETQIDPQQEREKIIQDFKTFLFDFEIPPSKYKLIKVMKSTYKGLGNKKNLKSVSFKKVVPQNGQSSIDHSHNLMMKLRISTDTSVDPLQDSNKDQKSKLNTSIKIKSKLLDSPDELRIKRNKNTSKRKEDEMRIEDIQDESDDRDLFEILNEPQERSRNKLRGIVNKTKQLQQSFGEEPKQVSWEDNFL
ncbi:unnamed protein product [Moneuplotes crassus]|uniref:Palmitoyltransferase n=1 Tax=Euplotes crassus TaxID=5936 RepID=A0AAD1UMT8_EUPCR|nr:unnamed protein product [Moneuplotes crassus]